MVGTASSMRALVDALDEPAMIVQGLSVTFANEAAKDIFGQAIEGRDIRFAIRHPEALEHILGGRAGDLDLSGIADFDRPWRVVVRELGHGSMFVRMIDRFDTVSAERMRVDFVANASHELRTPLSTVLGYAETLGEDGELDPALRSKFATTIRDEAARMLRIIEDLMSLSRIEADRFVAPSEAVQLGDVVELALASARQMPGGDRCEFILTVPDDLPAIRGDRAQLVQVFDNLLSNAVRYGCDGPGGKVELSANQRGRWVTVAAERAARPGELISRQLPVESDPTRQCPFCPGNEEATPPALETYGPSGTWLVRVVPNLFPAFEGNEPLRVQNLGPVFTQASASA